MKILIYTDNHFCQNSSIIRGRGEKYSTRLENQIKTLNWVEELSIKENCSCIIHAGDFFDKPDLNSEELSALSEIRWNPNIIHNFIVGNHDASNRSLEFSSTNVFSIVPNCNVISAPTEFEINKEAIIYLLPYQTLTEIDEEIDPFVIFHEPSNNSFKLLISHNDVKGLQYGKYKSTRGLNIDKVNTFCDLCINGHLHNSTWVNKKFLNLGNITGQNFSEDSYQYIHQAVVVDTTKRTTTFFENPHAFNFYKIDEDIIYKLKNVKNNAIVSITCPDTLVEEVKKELETNNKILFHKIIVTRTITNTVKELDIKSDLSYQQKFSNFVLDNIEKSDILLDELQHICGES